SPPPPRARPACPHRTELAARRPSRPLRDSRRLSARPRPWLPPDLELLDHSPTDEAARGPFEFRLGGSGPRLAELAGARAHEEASAQRRVARRGAMEPAIRLRQSAIPAILAVVGGGIRRMSD